jgi:hypothetical protein
MRTRPGFLPKERAVKEKIASEEKYTYNPGHR